MRTLIPFAAALLAACSGSAATAPPPAAPASTPSPACASAEHRQLDFWIGEWDVAIRARRGPTSEEWGEAKGTQRIEAILGGCVIAESFAAEGPGAPWSGRSYSVWQPQLGTWRQTWVDDSGGYLAFAGGIEDGEMRLYGEPRTVDDKTIEMRMLWKDVTADSLRWEWQRSEDGWQTSIVMMEIRYTRQ